MTRNNSVTGRRYCDDPTIMAWDLANEPYAPGDDTGRNLTARALPSLCTLRDPCLALHLSLPLHRCTQFSCVVPMSRGQLLPA